MQAKIKFLLITMDCCCCLISFSFPQEPLIPDLELYLTYCSSFRTHQMTESDTLLLHTFSVLSMVPQGSEGRAVWRRRKLG